MQGNPPFDVVIALPAVIAEFAEESKLAETRANVWRVGLGVAVRDGAAKPDISNADALKRAVLVADSLVYNRASTGLHLEGLLKKMEVWAQVESKSSRYPDGASVLQHVIKGAGKGAGPAPAREIGFAAITEIMLYQGRGLTFVRPVPPDVLNYTSYTATPLASGTHSSLAQQFVAFLSAPVGRPACVAAGVTD